MAQSSPTKIKPNPLSSLVPVGTYNGVYIFGPDHNIAGAMQVTFSNDTTDSAYFICKSDECKLTGLMDDDGKIEGMYVPTPPILGRGPGGRDILFDLKKNHLDDLALSVWFPKVAEEGDKKGIEVVQSLERIRMIFEDLQTIQLDLDEFEEKVNERLEKLEASIPKNAWTIV